MVGDRDLEKERRMKRPDIQQLGRSSTSDLNLKLTIQDHKQVCAESCSFVYS